MYVAENTPTYEYSDGRAFDEDGRVYDVNENKAIQPGDIIVIDAGSTDCRVIEVGENGILVAPLSGGGVDLSEEIQLVQWSEVEDWGGRDWYETMDALAHVCELGRKR